MRANISRQNNFLLLTPEEWEWIAEKILTDSNFSELSLQEFEEIIYRGIKGEFNNPDYPININATTIFRWLNYFVREKKSKEPPPPFISAPMKLKTIS